MHTGSRSTNQGELEVAFQQENKKFKDYYFWLSDSMPSLLFEELGQSNIMLVVHNLMELSLRDYVSTIFLKNTAIIICLDHVDADLQILKNFASHGITSYQTYVSNSPPPFLETNLLLRIVVMHFFVPWTSDEEKLYKKKEIEKFKSFIHQNFSDLKVDETIFQGICPHFLRALTPNQIPMAVQMYERAKSRDHCQYEVRYNEDWEAKELPSMQIVLAWRNAPKHNFLYRLIRTIFRHNLTVKKLNASYCNPYSANSILLVALELHGLDNKPVWEVANLPDFIKDLITVKYFASFDLIDHYLVQKEFISGNMGNLLRAMANFIHQALVHVDSHIYTLEHVEEGLIRHPELTVQLCQAFKLKFDPNQADVEKYFKQRQNLLDDIEKLDTGHEENDLRRKNILLQGLNFIDHTLKTNFYRPNYTSLSFRLNPKYLDHIPFDRTKKFPELPFGIFFIKGMHFFGFHIRFRDLARGGLRTVYPEHYERMVLERNSVFTECYNLALTQHMKNKDIPEGGAKGIIFLKPYERLEAEATVFKKELHASKLELQESEQLLDKFRFEQKEAHLYQAQRSFIESLMMLVNCDPNGRLRARDIVDYWNKPEYLYLGPDELMHDSMIQWIAEYSKKHKYKPGSSFISSKLDVGINHKQYGVTSLGVNMYVDAVLRDLGIDPTKNSFTVKMSGGPDGDVAGNEIVNLYRNYPKTAQLIALTDVSGTIFDPNGLNLKILTGLFHEGKSIRFYPPQELHDEGFLVDKFTKKTETPLNPQILCWRKKNGKIEETWLSGSDVNFLLRHNVHRNYADVFIPAGGRPRTLNATNYKDFLDKNGVPTSKAIVEGANLYFDMTARRALEELNTLIIKDSSANKTGVICSSFEVLCGLTLEDEKFLENKEQLVIEILERLKKCAGDEANLLLRTRHETGQFLTDISDQISRRINLFKDQLLQHLEQVTLSSDPEDPYIKCFLSYCLPTLKKNYQKELLREIPDQHKKAIIASHIASSLVYSKGLSWLPSIVDVLPQLVIKEV